MNSTPRIPENIGQPHPLFITVEGVDGAGKSTWIPLLAKVFSQSGQAVVETREPGGTPLGEKLRGMLLHEPMDPKTEIMLMFASRKEHLQQVILPALERGQTVVCDRFSDSSFAYQGGGKHVPFDFIQDLERLTHPDTRPGLTLLFDLPPEVSFQRLAKTGKNPDKFESQPLAFFVDVRQAYLARAKANSCIKIIDSSQSLADVERQVLAVAQEHLALLAQRKPSLRP